MDREKKKRKEEEKRKKNKHAVYALPAKTAQTPFSQWTLLKILLNPGVVNYCLADWRRDAYSSSCAHFFSLSVVFCSFHAQYSPSLTSA